MHATVLGVKYLINHLLRVKRRGVNVAVGLVGQSSVLKTPWTRDIVNPPQPIAVNTTSGIHADRSTLETRIPFRPSARIGAILDNNAPSIEEK